MYAFRRADEVGKSTDLITTPEKKTSRHHDASRNGDGEKAHDFMSLQGRRERKGSSPDLSCPRRAKNLEGSRSTRPPRWTPKEGEKKGLVPLYLLTKGDEVKGRGI